MERRDARRDPRLPMALEVRFRHVEGDAPSPAPPAEASEPPGAAAEAPSEEHAGRTRNVGAGGLFVSFEGAAPAVGTAVLLSIDAPSFHSPVEVRGEVRWVADASEGGGFGVRFIEADRRAQAALSALLEAQSLVQRMDAAGGDGPEEPR